MYVSELWLPGESSARGYNSQPVSGKFWASYAVAADGDIYTAKIVCDSSVLVSQTINYLKQLVSQWLGVCD